MMGDVVDDNTVYVDWLLVGAGGIGCPAQSESSSDCAGHSHVWGRGGRE